MNICIVGSGNMGHYIAAKVGNNDNDVRIYTSSVGTSISLVTAVDNGAEISKGRVALCTNNAENALLNAELVFITWPTNVLVKRLHEIEPYLTKGMYVGFIPGYGGKEIICKPLLDKGCTLFGTQRVLSSTKVLMSGSLVECIDNRPNIKMAAMREESTAQCCLIMEELFNTHCIALPNYLSVALTPSNPILHTARIYSLFKDYSHGQSYDDPLPFYSNWTDEASEILLRMDSELQAFCQSVAPLDLSHVLSLAEHYEVSHCSSQDIYSNLTKKLKSIKFLKDVAPMVNNNSGYMPDFSSRYFLEDFPYGLALIKGYCELTDTSTPQIDEVLKWYSSLMGLEYYIGDSFTGKDLADLPLAKIKPNV